MERRILDARAADPESGADRAAAEQDESPLLADGHRLQAGAARHPARWALLLAVLGAICCALVAIGRTPRSSPSGAPINNGITLQEQEPIDFDCAASREKWQDSWSDEKRGYCCIKAKIGCKKEFDCSAGRDAWEEGWSHPKKLFCCEREGVGCPQADENEGEETSTTLFVCSAGLDNWKEGWSEAKKEYCCSTVGIACPKTTTPKATATRTTETTTVSTTITASTTTTASSHTDSTSTTTTTASSHTDSTSTSSTATTASSHTASTSTTTATVTSTTIVLATTTEEKFDCAAGANNWKEGWSEKKKQYCCAQVQTGCETQPVDDSDDAMDSLDKDELVGTTTGAIHGSRAACRNSTCEYGTFVCEELLRIGREQGEGSQICMFPAGAIAMGLPEGKVTVRDILKAHPHGNYFSYALLNGTLVKAVIDKMLADHGPKAGASETWMQMAGLRFQASRKISSPSGPSHKGTCAKSNDVADKYVNCPYWQGIVSDWDIGVVQVKIDGAWKELRDEKEYNVIMNRFDLKGGRGYGFLRGVDSQPGTSARVAMYNMLKGGIVDPPKDDERHCLHEECEWLTPLGSTSALIDGDQSSCRHVSCAYGILLAEELLSIGRQSTERTQLVMIDARSIHGSLPKGPVTFADMARIHSWGNSYVSLSMSGTRVKALIQRSLKLRGKDGNSDEWMQVAGLRFKASWTSASSQQRRLAVGDGWRLDAVQVQNLDTSWEDMDDSTSYGCIVNRWSVLNDDDEDVLKDIPYKVMGTSRGAIIRLMQRSTAPIEPPEVDDRACLLIDARDSCHWGSRAAPAPSPEQQDVETVQAASGEEEEEKEDAAQDSFWDGVKFGIYRWILDQSDACDGKISLSDIAGRAVRFILYDFTSDGKVDAYIGANQSVNEGLDYVSSLMWNNSQVCPHTVSRADCAVVFSYAVLDIATRPYGPQLGKSPSPHGTGSEGAYLSEAGLAGVLDMGVMVGRKGDPEHASQEGVYENLESFKYLGKMKVLTSDSQEAKASDEQLSEDFADDTLDRVVRRFSFDNSCGITVKDVVSVLGVRTLGQAEFGGYYVNPSARSSTGRTADCSDGALGCGPSTLDNGYYRGFFEMGWEKDSDGFWRCIRGSVGIDVTSLTLADPVDKDSGHSGDSITGKCFNGSVRLPSDMALLWDLADDVTRCEWEAVSGTANQVQSTCRLHSSTWGEMVAFAADAHLWRRSLRGSWKKIVECGYEGLSNVSHVSTSDAQALFYPGGSLAAPLGDGSTETAGCGRV